MSSLDREHFKTFHNLFEKKPLKCFGQAKVSEPEVSALERNFPHALRSILYKMFKIWIFGYIYFFLLASHQQWSSGLALGLRFKGSGVQIPVSILGFQRQYILLSSRYMI